MPENPYESPKVPAESATPRLAVGAILWGGLQIAVSCGLVVLVALRIVREPLGIWSLVHLGLLVYAPYVFYQGMRQLVTNERFRH